MPKHLSSQPTELSRLATELNRLDAKRDTLIRRIQATIATIVGNGAVQAASPALRPARGMRRRGGRPKGFKVSAATKAKLRAA
jgi:hypothetical protein